MIATEYFNVLVVGGATELVRRPGPVCECVCVVCAGARRGEVGDVR